MKGAIMIWRELMALLGFGRMSDNLYHRHTSGREERVMKVLARIAGVLLVVGVTLTPTAFSAAEEVESSPQREQKKVETKVSSENLLKEHFDGIGQITFVSSGMEEVCDANANPDGTATTPVLKFLSIDLEVDLCQEGRFEIEWPVGSTEKFRISTESNYDSRALEPKTYEITDIQEEMTIDLRGSYQGSRRFAIEVSGGNVRLVKRQKDEDPDVDLKKDLDEDGYTAEQGDCDDNDPKTGPGDVFFPELCDGKDNDCDRKTGPGEVDADADGYLQCSDFRKDVDYDHIFKGGGDCNDNDADIYPGAPQICDSIADNDCDGHDDENEADYDNDGHTVCDGDLKDRDNTVYPGATELCDGKDNDCDDNIPAEERDEDRDGYRVCAGDCVDSGSQGGILSHFIHPRATEHNNGVDDNCDGVVDEGFRDDVATLDFEDEEEGDEDVIGETIAEFEAEETHSGTDDGDGAGEHTPIEITDAEEEETPSGEESTFVPSSDLQAQAEKIGDIEWDNGRSAPLVDEEPESPDEGELEAEEVRLQA
ncbi:putative metal-binding motif-containing protein, partial [Patescibacteria group bacterium]|nr:putative metal-binding motif-containing protein [Patescibacteria group bacterium]